MRKGGHYGPPPRADAVVIRLKHYVAGAQAFRKLDGSERARRVHALMKLGGVRQHAASQINALSSGEQKCGIGMAAQDRRGGFGNAVRDPGLACSAEMPED